MNFQNIAEEKIRIYSRQYKRLVDEILSAIQDESLYYSNGTMNKTRKLALLKQLQEILIGLGKVDKEFIESFEEIYKVNANEIIKDYELKTGNAVSSPSDFNRISDRDTKLLATDFAKNMEGGRGAYYTQISNKINAWDNQNRRFIESATAKELENIVVGGDVKKVAIKRLMDNLNDYGLTSYDYLDTKGRMRRINLETYAELQINSKIAYIVNKGVTDVGQGLGVERYQFSSHATHCALCGTYAEAEGVGRIYSMSKEDKYPWIGVIPNFLTYWQIHPNCRHRISLYVEEYSERVEKNERIAKLPFKDHRSKASKKRYDNIQKFNAIKRRNKKNLLERKSIESVGKDKTEKDKRKLKRLQQTSSRQRAEMKDLRNQVENYKNSGELNS